MKPPKIPGRKIFVQVTHKDLAGKLPLILFFRINCEVYVPPEIVDSFLGNEFDHIRSRLDKADIARRIHAPIHNPYTEGLAILKESFLQGAKLCAMLGCDTIVMHAEYEPDRSGSSGAWIENTIDMWEWIASAAAKSALTVLIENHREDSPKEIIDIIQRIGSPNLGACFDPGHFNVYSRSDMSTILGLYPKGCIREVHLSDNRGDSDSHLSLGKGNVKFSDIFEKIVSEKMDPVYTIEAGNIMGVIEDFRYLKRFGYM